MYNCMACKYIHKSISRTENIFVRPETRHTTGQTLNQVVYVLQSFSTQTMQSITYIVPRTFNAAPVNFTICKSFVNFKHTLTVHIASKNGDWLQKFSIFFLLFFLNTAFHVWFMSKAEFSTSYSQMIRIVLILSSISFTLIIHLLKSNSSVYNL